MRVVLSANVPHYYHAALTLQRARMLERYICAVGLHSGSQWPYRMVPEYWEKKLRGRDISGIDSERVKPLWLPEILQKGLPRIGVISAARGNWLNNHLYDWLASFHVGSCDIFHHLSSIGLYSGQQAGARGAVLLCEERGAHPDFMRRMVREEHAKLGITAFNPPGLLYDSKVKAEYAQADYLLVGSSFTKRTFVEAGYDPERIFVVPYGVDIWPDGSALPDDGGKFRIIYVGQIVPWKGIHYLVQAFEELGLPEAELLLVGAVGEEMRDLVEKWDQNSSITFTGSVPRLRLGEHYERSSVFVLPSVSDNWGLVVGEAMAAGLPVIVTENTGSVEMMRDEIDGYAIPTRDVESLKRKMLLLYENRERRREMGRKARSRVQEFSWKRYGERLISVYEEIARREEIAS